jgi:predicted MFS family arabinose efflux permease
MLPLLSGVTGSGIGVRNWGAGLSLVFPSLGIEAVRRVPGANRGAALGAYVMFFDIGLAVAGPATGMVARHFSYPAAFGAGAAAAAIALLITVSWKA